MEKGDPQSCKLGYDLPTIYDDLLSHDQLITHNVWSCDCQDSVRSLNEVAVMASKVRMHKS